MSFDKDTRNLLSKTVAACRRQLAGDVTDQLRGVFGLHPEGVVLPLEKLTHLSPDQHAAARRLRDLLDHYTAGAAGKDSDRRKAAYERMVLEISFTALNRLTALRLCEERGLVIECVSKGTTSAGFQMFERISGGALGGRYDTYRVFLECLFDELALDLGVLFERMTPQSAVFPSERCMEDVLAELNKTDLTHLWTEDETIGWVYQYFNPPEERKAMRDASQAPRNSRELAVRNQFFTPRYVVEFLTDNTLGRIWYEMRKGDTELKEECRYLVRRSNEVFLGPGEKAPAGKDDETGLDREELLKRPVYIEHRPKKDPRDLRILDPACGSGHFLLYAFDLLERIFEEAWSDSESPKSEVTGRTIQEDFETLDDLRRRTPKLIVEHNLHGIDIDPRAVQIAALSLWLRAQKAWKSLGLKAPERPRIARSNIVTAEPMPGEEDMRREFTAGLKPRVLGQIVDEVFEKMKLAGEAGSLLKIEEEIKDAVAAAGNQWREGPKPEQQLLFLSPDATRPIQQELRFDVKGVTDERFWDQAEDRILDALKEYAEQAENGLAVRRRLFAEDAARGFAFIDLSRKRYDVVLMNPPFGECSTSIKTYLKKTYKDNSVELYCAFVDRDLSLMHPGGLIGCITSSSFVLYTDFSGYREFLLKDRCLEYLANLGDSVLDGAYVYTACYIIRNSPPPTLIGFCDLRFKQEKDNILLQSTQLGELGSWRMLPPHKFTSLASSPLCHWASDALFSLAETSPSFGSVLEDAGVGAAPQADFFDLWWEVPPSHIGMGRRWVRIANGGAFSPYHRGDNLVVDWEDNGKRAIADLNHRYPYLNGNVGIRIQRTHLFGRPGITYGKRSDRFNAQFLPAEMIFTFEGIGVFPKSEDPRYILGLLAFLNSRFVAYYLNLTGGLHKNDVYIRRLPFPLSDDDVMQLGDRAKRIIPLVMNALAVEETHPHFSGSFLSREEQESVCDLAANFKKHDRVNEELYFTLLSEIESAVSDRCGLDTETLREVTVDQGFNIQSFGSSLKDDAVEVLTPERERPGFCRTGFEQSSDLFRLCVNERISPSVAAPKLNEEKVVEDATASWFAGTLLSLAIGTCFGRWDVRIALDPSLAPKLPDPFDPLPVCPPGMLVGADGLPAEPNRIVSEEWLRARPDGNTLPPEGSVKNPTIPDSDYPLRISWDGVLVDDPGFNGDRPHRDDVVRRVREVFDIVWKDKAHEIEQEACDILGVSDLRDYFRKPTGFFQDHLKRYSKSRRKAPIYWPLSTPSGSYTLWLYYHRLTDQTIYAAVNKYVEPKISEVERGIGGIENDLKSAAGRDATRLTDRLSEARTFLGELRDLREVLLRIAALPFKPDLNDGVIINASPFHSLFRLRPWAKDTEDCWKKLQKGDYDWAHLAYITWPDRVREVCRTDRSIAIAHGLEDLCEVEAPESKKKGGRGRRKKEAAR